MTTYQAPIEEPKKQQEIPVGIGTSLGVLGAMVSGVAALVASVWSGDHTAETIGALASAVFVLAVTIAGRFAQAYAIYRSKVDPDQIIAAMEDITAPPSIVPPPPGRGPTGPTRRGA